MTTYELLAEFIEAQEEYETAQELNEEGLIPVEKVDQYQKAIEQINTMLLEKIENINKVKIEKERIKKIIEAEKEVYKAELDRLQTKLKQVDKAWGFLEMLIKDIIKTKGSPNKSGNLSISTTTGNYTLVKRDGALEIIDETRIPEEFINYEPKIDKKKLKEYLKTFYDKQTAFAKINTSEVLVIK